MENPHCQCPMGAPLLFLVLMRLVPSLLWFASQLWLNQVSKDNTYLKTRDNLRSLLLRFCLLLYIKRETSWCFFFDFPLHSECRLMRGFHKTSVLSHHMLTWTYLSPFTSPLHTNTSTLPSKSFIFLLNSWFKPDSQGSSWTPPCSSSQYPPTH